MATCNEEVLFNRLTSADADVRTEAADRIQEQGRPATRSAVIDRLVNQLGARSDELRWQAARALGLVGSARGDVLKALNDRLGDSSKHVRRCAAEALGRIASDRIDSCSSKSDAERFRTVAERYGINDDLDACLDDDCEEVSRAASRAREALVGQTGPGSRGSGGSNVKDTDDEIREGEVYEGEVQSVKSYGAFVEILPGRTGLLHVSEMDYSYVTDAADYFQPGDRVRVKLLEISRDGKLSLTRMPFIETNPWDEIEEEYSVGDTASGEVVSIQDCGALVNLEVGVTGLIPVSEMRNGLVDHPSEVVSTGQQIETRVLEISGRDERVILHLKQSSSNGQTDQKRSGGFRSSNGRSSKDKRPGREVLLVDGSNVCRNWPASSGEASLNVLLNLLLELVDRGFDFECIFDANIPHVLQGQAESGAKDACRRLVDDLPGRMSRAPGGTDADDLILQKADRRDLRVVTNDRYRKKRGTYSWIAERESERLIKGSVSGTDLQVVPLDLFTEVRTDMQRMVDELLWAVRKIDCDGSQGGSTRFRGKLKFFDAEKGFGFIRPLGHDEDVYVNADNLSGTSAGKDLKEGQGIEFGVEWGEKGPRALDASPLR